MREYPMCSLIKNWKYTCFRTRNIFFPFPTYLLSGDLAKIKVYTYPCNFTHVIFFRFSLVRFATSVAIVHEQSRDNITRFTRFRNNQDRTWRGSSRRTLRKTWEQMRAFWSLSFSLRQRRKRAEKRIREALAPRGIQISTSRQGWNFISRALLSGRKVADKEADFTTSSCRCSKLRKYGG